MEDSLDPIAAANVDTAKLCQMFEDSEQATYPARQLAERDRDYFDGKQISAEERAALRKRKQPEVVINVIKEKIDYLVGYELQQRIDPKAYPRTPRHEQEAFAASDALRFVTENEDYDKKRSQVWRNLLIEGAGGIGVSVEPRGDTLEIAIRRYAWDRLFFDPHSVEPDFSDAKYLGTVVWMDHDDALAMYPDGEEALEATYSSFSHSHTYDDTPKHAVWADKSRKRIRIAQLWLKRDETWYFFEYTKGGILNSGVSPYVNDKGESDCELIFQSAYVDRDGNRYGMVRQMISLSDELNKRRSKALHLLNTAQVKAKRGAVDDIEKARREVARPDGFVEVNGDINDFQFNTRTDLAAGHVQMMQQTMNDFDRIGPNATMMGEKAGGSAAASGKAIIASQQGGAMAIGSLMDGLRHMDIRVFRAVWARIRQFWTEERWIRVTDDERNVKWIGMNVDPMQLQMIQAQNPQAMESIAGTVGQVAELDVDIIIDEAPDTVTPQLEQWEAIMRIAESGKVPIPPDVLIEAAPNLKNKDRILEGMSKPDPAAQAAQQMQMRNANAEVAETEASARLKDAQAAKAMQEANLAPIELMQDAAADPGLIADPAQQFQGQPF